MIHLANIYEARIQLILTAKQIWLFDEQEALKANIEKTVLLGFERSDIMHSLRWIKEICTEENLRKWCYESANESKVKGGITVIFLHAGNLPLVGFQDVLISILSGVRYNGKLSRKDPYLLASFIDVINRLESSLELRYSVDLSTFENLNADGLIFAGSDKGVNAILDKALEIKCIHAQTSIYLRTAHFSLAYFNRFLDSDWEDLAESILRYNGAGCRSVAIIVSSSDLNFSSCNLNDYVESWLLKNKQEEKVLPQHIEYYKSYYESIGIKTQIWNSALIVETIPQRLISGLVYWIKGDEETINRLQLRYGKAIQAIYGVGNQTDLEPLYKAQFPDLNWKADGIDLLKEFTKS